METWRSSWIHILGLLCMFGLRLVSSKSSYAANEYPDPMVDAKACNSTSPLLCDPEGILSVEEAKEIIDSLLQFEQVNTCYGCDCGSAVKKNRIMVAIVPRIKDSKGDVAYGFDAQLQAAKLFAEYLRDYGWSGYESSCRVFIVLVHDKYANLSWIATNVHARKVMSNQCVTDLAKSARKNYLLKGERKKGILHLTEDFRGILKGTIACSGSQQVYLNATIVFVMALTSLLMLS